MGYEEIVYERRNDAAWIGINRPEVRSAFEQGRNQGEASQAARP